MKRVLITGIRGFTGRYVSARLAELGHEVHGLAHCESDQQMEGVAAIHAASILNPARLAEVIDAVRPDHVVHLAAIAFVAYGNANELYSTNILGTRNLLKALADAEKKPESVLISSSANIYGNCRSGVLDEDIQPAPVNDYGVSKLAMEYAARLFSDRLPIIITRPFNYTGVGQSSDFIIAKIVDHVRRGCKRIELGNIDVARDFSDVRTVADAYVRLLDNPGVVSGVFNICSGRAYSLREVIDMVRHISNHDFSVDINPAFVRTNDVRSLCGSNMRLKAVIGDINRPDFSETLRWMLEA